MLEYLRTKLGIQIIFGTPFISLLLFGLFVPRFLRAFPLTYYNQIGQQCVVPMERYSQGCLCVVDIVYCLAIFLCCLVSPLAGGFLIILLYFFFYQYTHVWFPIKKKKEFNLQTTIVGQVGLGSLKLAFSSSLATTKFARVVDLLCLRKFRVIATSIFKGIFQEQELEVVDMFMKHPFSKLDQRKEDSLLWKGEKKGRQVSSELLLQFDVFEGSYSFPCKKGVGFQFPM